MNVVEVLSKNSSIALRKAKMSKKNAVFIAVVLSLLITSCGTKNLPTPTATSSATKTPTLTPTITPTFTPLPTPTITFTPTPAPISIDNAKMLVPMQTLEGVPAGWWSHLTFSPDLKKYIAYSDIPSPNTGNMAHVLYDTATGEQISTFFGPATNTHGNAFSPDSKILASIDDYGNLFLWDTATGELIKQLSLNYNGFSSVEFSPDGKVIGIASGNLDKGILVFFDVETGERLKRITCGGWCSEIAFSPDGATVASDLTEVGSKRSIVLWDVNTGEKIYSLSSPFNEQITDIEFSPDGKLVASSSEAGGITLWDAVSGQPISTFDNITRKAGIAIGENGPDAIAFSPDGKLLASGYSRGSIILWDTATTLPVYSMQGKYGFLDDQAIILIKFNANGTLFATSNKQQLATVWGISNFSIPTPTPTKKPSKVLLDVNDSFPAIDAPLSQFKFNQYTITALSLNYTIEVNTEDNTYGCFLVWRIDPSPAMGGALFAGASNVPGKFTIRQPGDYIITVQLARRSKQCEPFTYTLKVTQP